jgi:hypothetical protein
MMHFVNIFKTQNALGAGKLNFVSCRVASLLADSDFEFASIAKRSIFLYIRP